MSTQIVEISEMSNIIRKKFLLKYVTHDNPDVYYQGDINEDEKFEGYGKIFCKYFNYHGNFKNGMFEGYGDLKFNDEYFKDHLLFMKSYSGEFKEGMFDGKGRADYSNNEFYIGQFVKNMRHGIGTKYNDNGKIIFPESNWNNDILTDIKDVTLYHPNGIPKYKGGYNGISKDGKGTLYDIDSNPIYIGEFKDDKFHGNGKQFNNKGFIIREGNFDNGELVNGNFYEDNGTLKFQGKVKNNIAYDKGIIYNNNSIIDAVFDENSFEFRTIDLLNIKYSCKYAETFDKKINNLTVMFFKNGVANGEEITYNGKEKMKIISKYNIIDGLRNGDFEEYDKNGNLIGKGKYKSGLLDGKCEFFSGSSVKRIIGEYKKGKLTKGNIYFPNGNLKYSGIFDDNENFSNNGIIYFNNEPNSIRYQGEFSNGKFHGNGVLYFKNGHKKYEGHFHIGLFHGTGTQYYESTEMPEYIGSWLQGERHGEGTLMDESGTPIFYGNWHYNEPS